MNCGYCKGFSVIEVAKEFSKHAINESKMIKTPRRKGDLIKIIALNKNLKKFIKWNPKFNKLKLMVKSSLQWEKKLSLKK